MSLCVQHVELTDVEPDAKHAGPVRFPRVVLFDGEPVWSIPPELEDAWAVWRRPENGEVAVTLRVPRADVTGVDGVVRLFGRQVFCPPDPFEADSWDDARWVSVTFFASRVVVG
jgi:hypothetical protein